MVTRFGAYEILYELKSGGMGAVLLGRRRGPGAFEQLVAIKTIRAEYANAPQVRAMFLDEAAILARINHPGIATVHDFGEENGTLYMVMEYVAGIPFRDFADMSPPPTIAARAVAEACRGLNAAHEMRDTAGNVMGVVHRDISPDNLMLGFDGHVKVIDFGIALVKNRQSPVTEFGTVKGKPPYMSPEQIANESIDRRSDVFSLAVVLHELLAHQPLFDGDSIYAIAIAVAQKRIPPPSQLRGDPLPLGLDAVVMNALDRDVARRTQSAAAFAEALEQVIQSAGDETLAAWADRELAVVRAEHRVWLANIVAGVDAAAPRIGRATAQQTQVAEPTPPTTNLPAIAAAPPSPEPAMSTHLPAMDDPDLDELPRKSRVPLVAILLVLLVLGIGIIALTHKSSTSPPIDAAIAIADARTIDAPADAAALDAIVLLVPADAAGHTTPRDAAVVHAHHDAMPQASPPDAAEVRPSGSGFLTITHKAGGSYLNVVVDGKQLGVTPMFHKQFPAGAHTIELVAPDTGVVVTTRTITLEAGATVKVAP